MLKMYGLVLLLAAAMVLHVGHAQTLSERNGIINATLLSSLRDFPHQVGIHVGGSMNNYCSGSIISRNWVLTAKTCVGYEYFVDITLMFNRLNISTLSATEFPAYSLKVSYSAANVFDHGVANLALIRLPVALHFDVNVAPVALDNYRANFTGQHAVMAGIHQNTTHEAYGQFEIISDNRCNQTYPGHNEEQMLCTLGWQNSSTVPCLNNQGGGLIVDWPSAPRLVGVFSSPLSCLSYIPAQYYRISGYLNWIEDTVGQHVKNDGYFF